MSKKTAVTRFITDGRTVETVNGTLAPEEKLHQAIFEEGK